MDATQSHSFSQLIDEALKQDFSGWDFSWLAGRWQEMPLPWDYRQLIVQRLPTVAALLDLGTGGGEFLSSLAPLPPLTCATEAYPPNIPVARAHLAPLGIEVAAIDDDRQLPYDDQTFDLIINRHESFWSTELRRILKRGGRFITQQVGGANCVQLNEFLCDEIKPRYAAWTMDRAMYWLEQAGFDIVSAREAFPDCAFYDIGAVVFYLKIIEWQIPDFELERYRDRLWAMHQLIQTEGAFVAKNHRFIIEASLPA